MTDDSATAFKVSDEDFETLTEREGITQAAHFAKRKWVSVRKRSLLRRNEWESYVRKSYELVKAGLSKKVLAGLG